MRIPYLISTLLICVLMFSPIALYAGPSYRITFISSPTEEASLYELQRQITQEINALMKSRGKVSYQTRIISGPSSKKALGEITGLMGDTSLDCLIGIGIETSDRLIRIRNYSRPVIAAGVLDHRLQGLPKTPGGTSGINNFNYIESHFDVEKDLRTFKSLFNYKHLVVLVLESDTVLVRILDDYLGHIMETISPGSVFSLVEIDPDNIAKGLPKIPAEADAVYLLPLFSEKRNEQMTAIIQALNQRGLPSFALTGEAYVRMGAMAAIAPDRNINVMARRIAINVLDILEGRDAGTLPVSISRYADNFVLNLETLKKIDYYPSWEAMADARMLNIEKLNQGPVLQLKSVIFEALERNLDYLTVQTDTRIQEEAAGIARSALLPQVTLSAGLTRVDENQVKTAMTAPAQTTLAGRAGFNQTVFSDDILANYAIQTILTQSQRHQEETVLMDTVLTAAQAYINLLLTKSAQTIQNDNLNLTRKNLDIAKNKAAVGAINAGEVSRWESEQAANQISLNDAFRDLQLARMALNQVLDRPVTRTFTLEDIEAQTGIELMITDPDVFRLLGNIKQMAKFSDFLIVEADRNLPELKQLQETIRSQERQVLNRERAFYLPDVALEGSMDKVIKEYEYLEKTPSELDHPWEIALSASWPLFAGGAKKKNLSQSRYQLRRLQLEERNLRNQLYLNVRSSLETAAVSAREIDLSQKGFDAALKSFDIIQAGYAEGRNSVTELVDAQNAKVSSERSLASAKYQFVLDFLAMERAMGRFYFLEPPEEKQAFLHRLKEYMDTTPINAPRKN